MSRSRFARCVAAAAFMAAALGASAPGSFAQEKPPMDGAMIMLAQNERDAAIMAAVRDGDAEQLRVLLADYARDRQPLPVDPQYGTLLHMAASRSSEPALQMLLAAGLSPHVTTKGGATPLHHAARANQPRMIMALL